MAAIQNDYCKTAYCKIRPRLKVIFDIASGKFILYKIVCFFLKINNILIKDVFLSIIYKKLSLTDNVFLFLIRNHPFNYCVANA